MVCYNAHTQVNVILEQQKHAESENTHSQHTRIISTRIPGVLYEPTPIDPNSDDRVVNKVTRHASVRVRPKQHKHPTRDSKLQSVDERLAQTMGE
jgi:hypothetical protein